MQPGSARSTSHDANPTDPLRERNLPRADHLSIVPAHDVETAMEDQARFVVGPAHGEGIDDYCRSRRLSPAQRIELVLQACDALAEAHEEGIHHGNLEPGDMIVVDSDEGARVKVVGLGGSDAAATRTRAAHGCRIAKGLEFRSPEQVMADRVVATAPGDVYSLGVILYLLLVDSLPHDALTLEQARKMGMLSWTYDEGPLSLVARVSLLGARARQVADERRLDPSGLLSVVAGRLTEIVARALDPDPSNRHANAGELARELRR